MNIKSFFQFSVLLFALLTANKQAWPQMRVLYTATADISKEASKGRFAGTYVRPDGSAEMFFLTSDGTYGYNFSPEGTFKGESQGNQVATDLLTMQNAESQTKEYADLPLFKGNVIAGSSTWTGNLAVKTGELYLNADEKFNYGIGWEEHKTIKPKLDDTWMSKLIGYRSYSPYKKVRLQAYNHQSAFTFFEEGKFVVAPANDGSIQAAGVVVEKVSIKNPSPNAQNTIAVFSLSGENVDRVTSNVIVTPYSQMGMTVGKTSFDGMAIMVMPVNAPSTYRPHKRLRPEEGDRMNLYVYRVNKDNQVVDSVNFRSTSSVVTFQYLTDIDSKSDLIIGFGNDKKTKWRWAYAGMELNVMQFIKLDEQGRVAFHKTYSEEEIKSKLIVPGAKNNKLKLKFYNSPEWFWVKQLDNKNYFFFGHADGFSFAMLTDGGGNLINLYAIPHADPEKHAALGSDFRIRDNKIYLAIWDQPHQFTNEVTSETSSSTISGPYISTTITTTRTKQLFEIYHVTQLIKIDGSNGTAEQMWLGEAGKEFYTMHSKPVIFAEDAMYVPGKPKGPKAKRSICKRSLTDMDKEQAVKYFLISLDPL